jgi:DnaJ domain
MTSRYPLTWPQGWPRSEHLRGGGFQLTFEEALDRLHYAIEGMGGRCLIVSSNMRHPQHKPDDSGVAVYFELEGKQKVFACDTFRDVRSNVRAIALTIAALRSIERYGASGMLERALNAFEALPPPMDPWKILGIAPDSSLDGIEAAFKRLAFRCHPDRGGSDAKMAELNRARDEAIKIRD